MAVRVLLADLDGILLGFRFLLPCLCCFMGFCWEKGMGKKKKIVSCYVCALDIMHGGNIYLGSEKVN